jgi:hypothetical protein
MCIKNIQRVTINDAVITQKVIIKHLKMASY